MGLSRVKLSYMKAEKVELWVKAEAKAGISAPPNCHMIPLSPSASTYLPLTIKATAIYSVNIYWFKYHYWYTCIGKTQTTLYQYQCDIDLIINTLPCIGISIGDITRNCPYR